MPQSSSVIPKPFFGLSRFSYLINPVCGAFFQLFLYLIVMFLQTEQIRMSLFLGLGGINVAFQTQITASLWISNPNNLQAWKHLN